MASFKNMKLRELQSQEFSEEQKAKIKSVTDAYANSLASKLGREPNFDDVVKDKIEKGTYEQVDDRFNALKKSWELSGRDVSTADAVYIKYFNSDNLVPVMGSEEILRANEDIEKYARDPNLVVDYRKQSINHFDIDEVDIKPKPRRCIKCNKLFNTISNNTCSNCKKEEDDFKWFKPFSFNGAMYLGIACIVIYILYNNVSISYTGFLILGGLVLFAFTYFEDNYKKK